MNPAQLQEALEVEQNNTARWRDLAGTSALELHTRIQQALGLIEARLEWSDPNVQVVVRTLLGWSLEELVAGVRRSQ